MVLRGIHLAGAGVERLPGPPGTASRWAVQGRGVSSGARGFGRGLAGALAGDEFAVADGCVINSGSTVVCVGEVVCRPLRP